MSQSATVNVATHLAAMAKSAPSRAAVHMPRKDSSYNTLTFAELDSISGQIARGLDEIGIRRGIRTVLMVTPSIDFFTLTFALFKVGAVPVLIDPGMGIRNLGKCLAEAKPEAFIGIPKAHVARRVLRWARPTLRVTVTTGSRILGGKWTLQQLRRIGEDMGPLPVAGTRADETAAILFTSGSTGVAKGVVYTHGIFAAQVEYLKSIYGIEPGEVDLSTFPLFALFGPALGMTAVIPQMDPTRPAEVDPTKIISAIEQFGVTNLFGSPALINRVGLYAGNHGIKALTLKRAISAVAPVPAKVIETFTLMLQPGVQVFTPYGATESLPVSSIGSDVLLNETRKLTDIGCGVCVGKPVPGMEVRIISISDEPIAMFDEAMMLKPNKTGEIVVSGPVVTAEYFGRPQATQLAKMHDSSGRLWHRMGDVGYLDDHGRLWFCGRKSHRVEGMFGTMYTIQCEAVFNKHPDVFRTALVGVPGAQGIRAVLCVERDAENTRNWMEIETELRAIQDRYPHTAAVEAYLEHPKFPVDIRHNAKIFREKLAVWAAKKLARDNTNLR